MSEPRESNWEQIRAWRKAQRPELIARREASVQAQRREWNDRITQHLIAAVDPTDAVIGFCWPYKGEFDARFTIRRWRSDGATAALPEVAQPKTPLVFRLWWPGAPMKRGVYDIPFPDGTEILVPDIAIVPMNGFDARGYRLGYGGGYFDRTLAAHDRRVIAVGVSYEALRLDTIYPQPHDIPMDFVVTEAGVYRGGGELLQMLDATTSRRQMKGLMLARRLPRAVFPESGYSSPTCYASEFPGYFGEGEKD